MSDSESAVTKETWQVNGTVDTGAVNFPNFKRLSVRFQASDWRDALKQGPKQLQNKGTIVTLDLLRRVGGI